MSEDICSLPEFKDFFACAYHDIASFFTYGLLGNMASELNRMFTNFPQLQAAKSYSMKQL
jgi:hypothetical protein